MNSTPRLSRLQKSLSLLDGSGSAAGNRPADRCSHRRRRSCGSLSPQRRHRNADALPLLEKAGVARERRSSSSPRDKAETRR